MEPTASPVVLPALSVSGDQGVTASPAWGKSKGWSQASQRRCLCFPLQVQTLRPESLLLVSTLDGSLHALSKQTGDLKWTLRDGEQGAVAPSSLDPGLEWCHCGTEGENMGSGTPGASVCRQLLHLAAVWPWGSHSTSLNIKVLTVE